MRFELGRVSRNENVKEWEVLSVQQAKFLGTPPFWFDDGDGPRLDRSPIADKRSGFDSLDELTADSMSSQPQEEFAELYVRSEAAAKALDMPKARSLSEQIYRLVVGSRDSFDPSSANMIGNVAVTAEIAGATELSRRLYELSLAVNPNLPNNMQNFVDLIVKVPLPALYDRADELLQILKTEQHREWRPERTMALEARLRQLQGVKQPVDQEAVERLVEGFRSDPTDRKEFVGIMQLLDTVKAYQQARRLAEIFLANVQSDDDRYLAIRGTADILAGSDDISDELEAMEIYRMMEQSEDKETLDRDQVQRMSSMLNNYATLLAKHDYNQEAGRVWFEAYRLAPNSKTVRRAYGLFCVLQGRADIGEMVAGGTPLAEMPEFEGGKELPESFIAVNVPRWWLGPTE